MKIVANASVEMATRAGEFGMIARMFLKARGDLPLALSLAETARATPRVLTVLKTAIAAGSISNSTWGEQLAEYEAAAAAFIETLRSVGAFDAMLADMRRVPLRIRLAAVTVGATGYLVGEGSPKPISRLTLAGSTLAPRKAVAIFAMSDELARFSGPEGAALFGRELRGAVAAVTDEEFVRIISDGMTPIASSGATVAAVRLDLATALHEVETDASSKLFILVRASTAKSWSLSVLESGAPAFPEMTPNGGRVAGMPVLVTDGVPVGTIVVVDANGIAAASDTVTMELATQADLVFEDAPDSPPSASATMKSLWQHGMVALRAERSFGAERMRTSAVAVIEGVSYAGDSPV